MVEILHIILKYIMSFLLVLVIALPAFANPTVTGDAEVYYYNNEDLSATAVQGDTATLTHPTWCDIDEEWTGWTATELIIGHDREDNRGSKNDSIRNIKSKKLNKDGTTSWSTWHTSLDNTTYPNDELDEALFHDYHDIVNPQQYSSITNVWQRLYAIYTDYYTPYGEIYDYYPGGAQAVIRLANVYEESSNNPVKEVILEAQAWTGVQNGDELWGKFYIDKVVFENENGEEYIVEVSSESEWEPPTEVHRVDFRRSSGQHLYDWPDKLSYQTWRLLTAETYYENGDFKESLTNYGLPIGAGRYYIEDGESFTYEAGPAYPSSYEFVHHYIDPEGEEGYFLDSNSITITVDKHIKVYSAIIFKPVEFLDPEDWPETPPENWPEEAPEEWDYDWPDPDHWEDEPPANWPETEPENWIDLFEEEDCSETLEDISLKLDELAEMNNTLDDIYSEMQVEPGSGVDYETPSDGSGSTVNYDDITNPGPSQPTDYDDPTMPDDLQYTDPIPEAPPLPGVPEWELPGSWPSPIEGNPSTESTPSSPESPSSPSSPGTITETGSEVTPGTEQGTSEPTGPGETESPTQETSPSEEKTTSEQLNPGGGLSTSEPIESSEPIVED